MSGGRGAGDPPVTYQGAYDATRTYLPRQLVTNVGVPYMSLSKQTGVAPPGATWLTLGAGGFPMHDRGPWSAGVAYERSDVVTNAYGLYVALASVPSTGSEPVTGPTYAGTPVVVGDVTNGSPQPNWWAGNSIYQAFTVGASAITIDLIRLTLRNSGHPDGHVTVGIASAIGANPAAVTFLPGGSVAATFTAINGTVDCTLPGSVTLAAGTTYYLAVVSTDSGGAPGAAGLAFANTAASVSGGIASASSTVGDADGVTTTAWTAFAGYTFLFGLYTGAHSPLWQKIANTGNQQNVWQVPASGAAVTIPNPEAQPVSRIVLTANCALTIPTSTTGETARLILVQDATGSRTVTWVGVPVLWPGGTAPTLTTTPGKSDVVDLLADGSGNWLGKVYAQNY